MLPKKINAFFFLCDVYMLSEVIGCVCERWGDYTEEEYQIFRKVLQRVIVKSKDYNGNYHVFHPGLACREFDDGRGKENLAYCSICGKGPLPEFPLQRPRMATVFITKEPEELYVTTPDDYDFILKAKVKTSKEELLFSTRFNDPDNGDEFLKHVDQLIDLLEDKKYEIVESFLGDSNDEL